MQGFFLFSPACYLRMIINDKQINSQNCYTPGSTSVLTYRIAHPFYVSDIETCKNSTKWQNQIILSALL